MSRVIRLYFSLPAALCLLPSRQVQATATAYADAFAEVKNCKSAGGELGRSPNLGGNGGEWAQCTHIST